MKGYRINDLMHETGATHCQIQRWRKHRLIPPAIRAGAYSYYPPETVAIIRTIRHKLDQNMTLVDIRDWLNPPDDP